MSKCWSRGFTRVGEFHYVHHDCDGTPYGNIGELTERICSAAHTAGIGLTLLPSFYAHSRLRRTAADGGPAAVHHIFRPVRATARMRGPLGLCPNIAGR